MTTGRWGWVAVLALGCGNGDGPTDAGALDDPDRTATSGTRLKLRWFDLGGVRTRASALFDAQRAELCLPRRWSDGKLYCVPDAQPVVYTDDQCSQAVALATTDPCGVTRYVAETTASSCDVASTHLYPLGESLGVGEYYQRTGTSCLGPYTSELRALGPEVAPSALVELVPSVLPARGRIARQFLTSGDGARVPDAAHDTTLDARCRLQRDASGQTGTCVPDTTGFVQGYRDATCSAPIAAEIGGCGTMQYTARSSNGVCADTDFRYFAVGAPSAAPAPLYQDFGAGCAAREPLSNVAYYEVGAEVELAALTRSHDEEPGRAVQRIYLSDGKTRLDENRLYDPAHDVECTVTSLADGALRCLAFESFVGTFYTDAACTQPIELAPRFRGPQNCAAPPVPRYAIKELTAPPGTCSLSVELHEVGAAYTGPVFQRFGTCGPADPNRTYYQVGAIRPLGELPSATLITDP